MTKELLHVMSVLHIVRMKASNVRKIRGTTKRDKSTIKYDVRTTQCDDRTGKCEKKIKEPPNVTKELSHMMLKL